MSVSISVGRATARGLGWSVSQTPGTVSSAPVSVSTASGKAIGRGLGASVTRTLIAVPTYTELAMTLARKRVILTLGSNAMALELPRKNLRMEID